MCIHHTIYNIHNGLFKNSYFSGHLRPKLSFTANRFFKSFWHGWTLYFVKKLEHYGIRGLALDWLKSYLVNRKQFVSVNGSDSAAQTIKHGIPQGVS